MQLKRVLIFANMQRAGVAEQVAALRPWFDERCEVVGVAASGSPLPPRAGEADLIVAKHRNGPTATVTVAFQGHYSRFVDMAPG